MAPPRKGLPPFPLATLPSLRLCYADLAAMGYVENSTRGHVQYLFDTGEMHLAQRQYEDAARFYEELEQAGPAFDPRIILWARLLECHTRGGLDGVHNPATGAHFEKAMDYGERVVAAAGGDCGDAHLQLALLFHLKSAYEKSFHHFRKARRAGAVVRPMHCALLGRLTAEYRADKPGTVARVNKLFAEAFDASHLGVTAATVRQKGAVCSHEGIALCWTYYDTLPFMSDAAFCSGHPLRAFQWHWLKPSSDSAAEYLLDHFMRMGQWGSFHTLTVQHLTRYDSVYQGPGEDPRSLIQFNFRWFYEKGYASHVGRSCHGPNCTKTSTIRMRALRVVLLEHCTAVDVEPRQRTPKKEFRACSRCPRVYYCSETCQKAAWEAGHRDVCGKMTALLAQFKALDAEIE